MSRRTKTQEHIDSDPVARAVEREMVRRDAATLPNDFKAFVKAAWNHVEKYECVWGMHLDAICEHLQAAAERRIKRLCINMPPRAGKSTLVSVLFPAWVLARSPKEEFLFASYSATLAIRDSVKTRTLIESDWYQSRFPHVEIREDQNLKTSFVTTAGGGRQMTSVGGTVTGLGGSFTIVDDPMAADQGESSTVRESTNTWFTEAWSNRISGDPNNAVRIVVMQRLHSHDVSQVCIDAGWDLLSLPMEFESVVEPTSIGWVDPRTEFGELLWPERFNREVTDDLKKTMQAYSWAGQYQQRPAPRGGGIIKKHWLKFWYDPSLGTPDSIPTQLENGEWVSIPQIAFTPFEGIPVSASWDMTFKGGAKNDFVVGQAWHKSGTKYILLDQTRGQMDFPAAKAAVRDIHTRWNPLPTYVEAKANGQAIMDDLRDEVDGFVPVDPRGDKYSRLNAVSALFEGGNVYLPHPHQVGWVTHAIDEITMFPRYVTDDIADCMSQALVHMRGVKTYQVDLGSEMGGKVEASKDYDFVTESYWAN